MRSFFRYASSGIPSTPRSSPRSWPSPTSAQRDGHHLPHRREIEALLAAPDQATWTGRRDHALLVVALQTGLRLSELTGLTRADVYLGTGAHVSCRGKGRKQRSTPLPPEGAAVMRAGYAN